MLSIISGWISFTCWSVSYYPQIVKNFKRKNISGENINSIILNVIGFIGLCINVIGIYFFKSDSTIFKINDLFYCVHGLILVTVIFIQGLFYGFNNQRLNDFIFAFILILITMQTTAFIISLLIDEFFIYFYRFCGYIKIISNLKYFSQIFHNYQMKSTSGYSKSRIILNIFGALFSLIQEILDNYSNIIIIFYDFTKFGVALTSLICNLIFLLQFVKYHNNSKKIFLDTKNLFVL